MRLIDAIAQVESGGHTDAVSSAGAKGLCQLMDATGKEWHGKLCLPGDYDPFDAWQNKMIANAYIGWLLERYENALLAVAAYNAGPGTIDKAILAAGSRSWPDVKAHLPKETRAYVPAVMRIWKA